MYRAALATPRTPGPRRRRRGRVARRPEGVLAFRRGDFVCVADTTPESVTTPAYGRVLLASGQVLEGDGDAKIPADTTVWFTTA
ncbi:DUF3459 domain-containing protein [Streptomyces minutiscleroticus]|uniref:DUF3459 domain-containing protein n=1 Tax=Streptomyces minutiscleroticus TaxID=68238 RepID=UPI003571653F